MPPRETEGSMRPTEDGSRNPREAASAQEAGVGLGSRRDEEVLAQRVPNPPCRQIDPWVAVAAAAAAAAAADRVLLCPPAPDSGAGVTLADSDSVVRGDPHPWF
jgi:hypothetical protein